MTTSAPVPGPTLTEIDVPLPDGRVLHVFAAPDQGGELLVSHHGTPGSGLRPSTWSEIARNNGFRLVSYDRPGYGGSSRHPGRTVADAAADVASIADALGYDDFCTFGTSGGGPHALACAALLDGRARAAATFASVAPFDAPGLDWLAGMGQDNLEEFGAAQVGEDALQTYLTEQRKSVFATNVEDLVRGMSSLLPQVDVAALTGDFGQDMLAQMRRALADGVDGWLDDDQAIVVRGWGFDLTDITVPVLIAQGRKDLMVPYAHGEWLAQHVPGAKTMLSDEDGHLSMRARLGEVLAWLANGRDPAAR